jgi:hypothetical protein
LLAEQKIAEEKGALEVFNIQGEGTQEHLN